VKTQAPRRQRRRFRPLILFVTLLVLIAVIIGTATDFRREAPPLPEPEPVTDPHTEAYIEKWGDLDLSVKRNGYDETAFSILDDRVGYAGAQHDVLHGVDVSDHNGEIDWKAVQADGIDFAILRLGYRGYGNGAIVKDERFFENAEALEKLSMDYGVYFFSQAISVEEAVEEAEFVLQQLHGHSPSLPIYFDWELVSESARTAGMDPELLTQCALAFCQTIENAGFEAGIYFNQEFGYRYFNLITLKDYDFWLAEYAEAPSFYYHFHQWQYSCTGTVAGIPTAADLNLRFIPKST